ncbi:MAG: serine/threonine-protein kinase [Myxococcota bacterium]
MTTSKTAPDGSRGSEIQCPHCGQVHPSGWSHCPNTGKALTAGPALVGRIVAGRYEIHGVIGEGGMGAVYEATHLAIGRRVALKRLHPELAVDGHAVHRFQREARAAGATGHENIVDILDLGFAEDGAPFLVMELLEGETLAAKLRRESKLTPRRAASIAGQVLAALEAVHDCGVIHRDLKPDNIFLTRRGGRRDFVKVLDFGVSKVATTPEATQLTRTGMMVGTPHYMSPEQARGMREVDHRVDLYALGVILYESLSGQLPFRGKNYHALLQSILTGGAERLQVLVPTLPHSLCTVVHRALARTPEHRFLDARAMRRALVPFGADPVEEEEVEAEPSAPSTATAPTSVMTDVSLARETSPLYVPVPFADRPRPFALSSADWQEEAEPLTTHTPVTATRARLPETPYSGDAEIKGAFVLAARRDLGIRHGKRADDPLHALTASDRGALDDVILPVTWLPAPPVLAWFDAVDRILGRGDSRELLSMGRAVAGQLLPTRHPVMLRSSAPNTALERVPTLWGAYVKASEVTIRGKRVEVLRGPESRPFLQVMAGFVQRYLELSGALAPACQTSVEPAGLEVSWN